MSSVLKIFAFYMVCFPMIGFAKQKILNNSLPGPKPNVVISKIVINDDTIANQVFNRIVKKGDMIKILFSIHKKYPLKIHQYRYRLLGLDHRFIINDSNCHFAVFPNLPPGKYVFQVFAINELGIGSEYFTKVSFKIERPYYQQMWFYIVNLFVIGLIYLAVIHSLYVFKHPQKGTES